MLHDALQEIHNQILKIGTTHRIEICNHYFRTGPGGYGEGDIFLGITVPQARKLAKAYKNISKEDTLKLLNSRYHEERFIALVILIDRFEKADEQKTKKEIFDLYLRNIKKNVNSWDLIDVSSPKILGAYLYNFCKKKEIESVLLKLAESKNLWENRASLLATFYFISKHDDYSYSFKLGNLLLNHPHDLIHKALGWMLREIYKRNGKLEVLKFIEKNREKLPKITIRYALEKMSAGERIHWFGENRF